MNVAVIENGIVANIIVANSLDALGPDVLLVEAVDGFDNHAQIGHAWDGARFAPPALSVEALGALKNSAIAKTYTDVDAVHNAAVGSRATEYTEAETAAREYITSGAVGPASSYVADFALYNPTGLPQTDRWAAESIISRADAFRNAQLSMRSTRFIVQKQMRDAATKEDLDAAVAQWDQFIANLRAQLGV